MKKPFIFLVFFFLAVGLTAESFDGSDVFAINIQATRRAFGLTAPNGGESWPLDSIRDITWNASNLQGTVRLDLYKGGTELANKIGTITTNTPASTGKFTWTVGSIIGGKAATGGGYLILISSYTPEQKDASDGPFTITQAQLKLPLIPSKRLSLTYPRRADVLHKGTGYSITWTYAGLAEFPVRLDLLNNAGTAVVLTIAENTANDGKHFWDPPLSLPDAATYYKMRIRTMDGKYSDTVGPFTITKALAAPKPPIIFVLAPVGPEQVSTGIVYPIRWKSTCSKAAEGPAHDAFDIHLMDSGGTQVVKTLLYGMSAVYDSGNPDGSHSWHWDWHIDQNEKAGTYRIAVTSLSGQCTGKGGPFQLVHPQEFKEYTFSPAPQNCFILYRWWNNQDSTYDPLNLTIHDLQGLPGLARVGFMFFWNKQYVNYANQFNVCHDLVLRSKLVIGDKHWYKDMGHLLSAKMTIERKWKTPRQGARHPCLGGVVVLTADALCILSPNPLGGPSGYCELVGKNIPIDTSQGDIWEVDLTPGYAERFKLNLPDYGLMLYPSLEWYDCPDDYCVVFNAESYKVTLKFRFAKDITP
jgi:hypothetical protein